MNVSSYLELYLSLFGWILFDQIWDIMTASGLAYLPFVGMLLKNIVQPMYKQDFKEASSASLRTIELDIFSMLTVVVLATQPLITMDFTSLSYTKACSVSAAAVAPGSTGTTYDKTFTEAAIGGNTAQVPIWWYGVLALSAGFDDAVINSIPCSADIRLNTYKMQNARVKDPALRRQVQLFTNDCYSYAMSRYLESPTVNASPYPADDLYWLGSSQFTNDFYNNQRASESIPGFNYSATRDLEYDTAIETPTYGKPTCNEWWTGTHASDPKYGLRQALLKQIDATHFDNFNSIFASLTGKTKTDAEDIAIKTLINREKSYFNGLHNLQNYNDRGLDVVNSGAGTLGGVLESISFYPKMYMVKVAAPILQASVLMIIYTLLPFVILFSSYNMGVMVFMSVAIFSVKFWTVLWAIAHWLDNHLIVALKPDWVQLLETAQNNLVAEMVINFVTGGLFIALPLFWSGVLGWAGFKVGSELSSFTGQSFSQANDAGASGGKSMVNFAQSSVKK
jgi:hypothetical protein